MSTQSYQIYWGRFSDQKQDQMINELPACMNTLIAEVEALK